jgi:hypothetical protein
VIETQDNFIVGFAIGENNKKLKKWGWTILIDYFILVMLANTKKIDNILLVECEETGIHVEMLTRI